MVIKRKPVPIDPNTPDDKEAEKFFRAAYRYRAWLKREHPSAMGGVIWLRRGNEMVCYSECGHYTDQICSVTHKTAGDELVFVEAKHID